VVTTTLPHKITSHKQQKSKAPKDLKTRANTRLRDESASALVPKEMAETATLPPIYRVLFQ
jgi:hypothetical protein